MANRNGAQGKEQEEGIVLHVNLDEIIEPKLTITHEGKKYKVHPIDGVGFEILAKMEAENSVALMYELASTVLDGAMPEEEIKKLSPAKVAQIVKLAANGARQVEKMANPNSGRPAKGRSRAKAR